MAPLSYLAYLGAVTRWETKREECVRSSKYVSVKGNQVISVSSNALWFPTDPFTREEPQNPSINESNVARKHQSTDLEAIKVLPSGISVLAFMLKQWLA